MKLLRIVIAVLVIGFIGSKCSMPSTSRSTQTQAIAQAAPAAHSKPEWLYDSYEDKMTGDTGRYATLKSINTADLEFPYQGPQQAEISVHEGDGVIFRVEKGQLNCNRTCSVLVKLDEKKADYYSFSMISDKNLSLGSLDNKLGKRLYSSKHMTVRVFFFQNGSFDFEFDVAGLKPFPKVQKTKKA